MTTAPVAPLAERMRPRTLDTYVGQQHILGKDQPLFKAIKQMRDQNKLLKEARDILLPRLMTGMIDVEKMNIEKQVA